MPTTASIDVIATDGPRAGARGWAALAVLMLPVLLVSVDNTVLSFALPEIAVALAPTGEQQLWIIDAYPLVLAGLLVTMGTLGDRFGGAGCFSSVPPDSLRSRRWQRSPRLRGC